MVKVENLRLDGDGSATRFQLKLRESAAHIKTHDWPRQLQADMAWQPEQLASEDEFMLKLSELEVDEVRDALRHFKSMFKDVEAANVSNHVRSRP